MRSPGRGLAVQWVARDGGVLCCLLFWICLCKSRNFSEMVSETKVAVDPHRKINKRPIPLLYRIAVYIEREKHQNMNRIGLSAVAFGCLISISALSQRVRTADVP